MPLFSSDLQPIVVVVYILVAVIHIVSGLSLRDCSQLLFTLQLLINVMVETFMPLIVKANTLQNLSP